MRRAIAFLFFILLSINAVGTSYAQPAVPAVWKNECTTPWGSIIYGGESVTAYQSPSGPACGGGCVSESRTCSGNQLSGSYTYQSCSGGCGGTCVGGYCWYAANWNESCDNACSGHGGCNLTGTRDYAGSNGSDGNCQSVLNALGYGGYPYFGGLGTADGCAWYSGDMWVSASGFRGTSTTDCSTPATGGTIRTCACNN